MAKKKISPEVVQQVLAAVAASGLSVKPAKPFEKMDKARAELGLPKLGKAIKKANDKAAKTHATKNRLTQLAQAREAYFRKMGFGKFRKQTKKAPKKVAVKKARGKPTQLAAAREAYFRKMGYGKYRKAS